MDWLDITATLFGGLHVESTKEYSMINTFQVKVVGEITLMLILVLLLVACKSRQVVEHEAHLEPISMNHAECALCGMTVRDQVSPRGQVVHTNGHHAFLCSIGDLVTYVHMPSSHGAIKRVYVEAASTPVNIENNEKTELIWLPASQLSFVAGVPRKRVMGEPALAYDNITAAKLSAREHGLTVLDWKSMLQRLYSGSD